MDILIFVFEVFGTVAFSVSGVIAALKRKMDLLGVLTMGFVTALGGGIIRDVILGQTPPKVFLNPVFPIISIMTSLAAFLLATKRFAHKHPGFFDVILFIMDSIGLGIFTVIGVEASQDMYGLNIFLNIFMGTLTGVGGGVMRDMFCCQLPLIFTKHFYATASIIGSTVYIVLNYFFDPLAAGIVGMVVIVLLRLLAYKFLWNLPKAE